MRRVYQNKPSESALIADSFIPAIAVAFHAVEAHVGEAHRQRDRTFGPARYKVLANCEPGAALLNYSIQYKNARGLTARSEYLPFTTDHEAIAHGRAGSGRDAIIEVWKGDHLLVRLFGIDKRQPTTGPA